MHTVRDITQQYYHSYARSEKSSTYVEMRMMLCGVVDPLSRPNVALFSCSKVKNEDVKRVKVMHMGSLTNGETVLFVTLSQTKNYFDEGGTEIGLYCEAKRP